MDGKMMMLGIAIAIILWALAQAYKYGWI